MKERPILFNAKMVRALLDGRKTQTRRIIKPQPTVNVDHFRHVTTCRKTGRMDWQACNSEGKPVFAFKKKPCFVSEIALCPYGQPGDRLWVRETWSGEYQFSGIKPSCRADHPDDTNYMPALPATWYWADGEPRRGDWERPRPSIHMPRWASRITLEIVSVHVERLQDISEADATAEGCYTNDEYGEMAGDADVWPCQACDGYQLHMQGGLAGASEVDCDSCDTPKKRFKQLWQSINGFESWEEDPWVWVIKFKKVDINE